MKDNKVIFVQPALPSYRVDFFDNIHKHKKYKLVVYYSDVDMSGLTQGKNKHSWGVKIGKITDFKNFLQWQSKAINITIKKSDIIVISGAPRCISNLILLIKAKTIGAKVIWWGHLNYNENYTLKSFIKNLLMKYSSALLFYTDREVDIYKKSIKKPQLTYALNNGINTKQIIPLRKEYKSNERNSRIVFIGRVTEKSNIRLLIEALSLLPKSIELDVIGDGELKNDMIKYAATHKVNKQIVWHGSIIEEESISKIMNRAKINVYPGNVGLSLIHAMAYGLPTIIHGRESKHMPEIYAFQNNKTGLTFDYKSSSSLANSIKELICDDLKLHEYSMNCIRYTCDNFNTVSMSVRFINMIETISKDSSA